ncbi:MAG TPA: pyrroloquinoline quinone biosynthesis peptide chaperone PqqD [Streptosporangiaceae bacterium]
MPARTVDDADRPRLARHVRLRFDRARGRHVLLAPEAVSVLNGTGATILGLCDGRRTVSDIVAELRAGYDRVDGAEVRDFIAGLVTRRCVEVGDGPVADGRVGDGREAGDGRTG